MGLVRFALLAAALAAAGTIALTSGGLPATVATHFAGDGRPNGWMTRDAYVFLMSGLALVLPLLVWVGGGLVTRRWPHLASLPRRDFWLAPQRIDATLDAIERFGAWIAILGAAFFVGIHAAIVAAHRSSPPHLAGTHVAWLIGSFVAGIVVAAGLFHRRFRAGGRG